MTLTARLALAMILLVAIAVSAVGWLSYRVAALAMLVASSLTRPISRLTAAVERIGRSDQVAIPVDAGGETGVLARAFARVMGDAHAKTAALEREVREHRHTEAARDHHATREHLFSSAVESSHDAVIT